MQKTSNKITNIYIILFIMAAIIAVCSSGVYAVSVPGAVGQINSSDGAVLRKSASTSSKKLAVLSDDTTVMIKKEVFVKKTSTSTKNKWYYVTANGKKGYVRSDLVDNVYYGSVSGKIKSKVNYRKGAGTKMKNAGKLKKGSVVTVVLKANPVRSTKGSNCTWYKVEKGGAYYYVCSSRVKLTGASTEAAASSTPNYHSYIGSPATNMTDKQFEDYLNKQGFPDTYKKGLKALHKAHPNWGFVAYKTNIQWADALSRQTSGSTSLVSGVYPSSYRAGSKQYEPGWYKSSSTVVGYFMDPRNFLDETGIYMFEDLSYKPAYQTTSVVGAILSPCKLPSYGFTSSIFVNAGAVYNVSPVFLASRARQETGSGGNAVNGTKILGTAVYNPFNIGAFGGTDPLYNGLLYAYLKGWTTPAKAVSGGAEELAKNYINKGQYTVYYQRFNVRNGVGKNGTHQYMTNIMAPYGEAQSTKNSYSKYGITNQPLVFEIPIYEGMPASTKLP
ncbi:MAG: SH3 domain-containing protein [Mogibacterium sp.]|nr:SH3 domain-containing protein [Mogibacterium sp.]